MIWLGDSKTCKDAGSLAGSTANITGEPPAISLPGQEQPAWGCAEIQTMSLRRPCSCTCTFQHSKQPCKVRAPVLCHVPARSLPTDVAAAVWEVLGGSYGHRIGPTPLWGRCCRATGSFPQGNVSKGSLGDVQAGESPRLAWLLPSEV